MRARIFITGRELWSATEVAEEKLLESQQLAIETVEKYESYKEHEVQRQTEHAFERALDYQWGER